MSRGFVCVWCGERVWCPATPDLDHGEHESPAARKHRRHIVNAGINHCRGPDNLKKESV
jgi:hypothetical protein